jgi:hypothetical protein
MIIMAIKSTNSLSKTHLAFFLDLKGKLEGGEGENSKGK